MSKKFDPYQILNLSREATAEAIKRAYRDSAKDTHPDAGGDAGDFEQVSRAYLILSDPVRRRRFDTTGDVEDEPSNALDIKAKQKLATVIDLAISDESEDLSADMIAVMRICLGNELAELKKKKIRGAKVLKKAKRLEAKFKRKSAGENVFARMVGWRREQIEAEILEVDREIEVINRAFEIADEHTFDADQPAPQPANLQFYVRT